jgi:hypothetical protein
MRCGKQSFVVRLGLGLVVAASFLALAASAEGREEKKKLSDAEITKLLVGQWSWQGEVKAADKTAKVKAVGNYKKDGTFSMEVTAVVDTATLKDTYSGTWKVADGAIEFVLTEVKAPGNPKLKVGDKGKDRVVALNETTLTKVSIEDGKPTTEMTFKRVVKKD